MAKRVCFEGECRVKLDLDLTRLSGVRSVSKVGDGERIGLESEGD